jgi:hypothetical protein
MASYNFFEEEVHGYPFGRECNGIVVTFLEAEGVISLDIVPRCQTIN